MQIGQINKVFIVAFKSTLYIQGAISMPNLNFLPPAVFFVLALYLKNKTFWSSSTTTHSSDLNIAEFNSQNKNFGQDTKLGKF